MKMDFAKWKEFKISDVFITNKIKDKLQVPTGASISRSKLTNGNIPRISVTNINNGILGCFEDLKDDNYRVYENFISVSFLGTVFYQKVKSSLDMKVHCLKLKDRDLTTNIALFLVSVIRNSIAKYAYSDQLSSTVLPHLKIFLPTCEDGSPNFEFMENYIIRINKNVLQNIDKLKTVSKEIQKSIDITEWRSFKVCQLFTNIVKPPVLHSYQVNENSEGLPYVVRTKFNNGIKCLVTTKCDIKPSPSGVISWGAENASFFYQPKPFFSGRDIYYLDSRKYSFYVCLFLVSCLQTITHKYPYNFGLFPELLKKEKIKLPVTDNGTPDFDYMEKFMKDLSIRGNSNLNNLISIL